MEKNIDYKKEFDLACEKLAKQEKKIEKLKEEVEQLKNQRIFNSNEYDLITLTSTTPQWELIKKNNKGASTFTIDGFTAVGKSVSSEFMEEDTLQELRDIGKL